MLAMSRERRWSSSVWYTCPRATLCKSSSARISLHTDRGEIEGGESESESESEGEDEEGGPGEGVNAIAKGQKHTTERLRQSAS